MLEEVIVAYGKLQKLDPSNELLRYIVIKDGRVELNEERKFKFTGEFCSEAEDPKKMSEFKTWDEYCQFVLSTLYRTYLNALERAISEAVMRN